MKGDGEASVRLFNRTTDADEILRRGFRDSPRYLVDRAASGVWLSYRPLDVEEGADAREYSGVWLSDVPLAVSDETPGDDLVLEIPEGDVRPFEWAAEVQTCRGFFVPAEVLNRYPVRRPKDDERSVPAHEGVDPTEMADAHERLKRQSPPADGQSTG
jgi:hypothetical protein